MKQIITIHYIGGSTMEVNKTEAVNELLGLIDGTFEDNQFVKLPSRSGGEVYVNLSLVTSLEVRSI
ncbi:hypothetical protein JEOAER750_01395 [Jeotgalicoccus aerolatus]|uniref:Uncharacterized protein n=1 Tax=Jeotgalicoccus aerolatus TaxID=709510 RepID=A0ABS4HKT9_9STAP|nr:hypothetical protein [Jeotgalicoccus aerolatus]MBP1951543.1 hypothetical protein [Jeotgalicoccus aerolatus]GGD96731.1 hypothetical protein GCM10007273_06330 [Jeotgalicoccus aerolatus]CAD2076177.1 hypothetical protein JEOAER750_01395 [Jeotgalicoccus aerolatus]